jgi:hypothetical protein
LLIAQALTLHRFLPLIEAEQKEEEAIIQERLSSWSIQRLRSEGYCLTDMAAYWMEQTHFGRPVAAFSLGPGVVLPAHRFECVFCRCHISYRSWACSNGLQVLVTRLDPLRESPQRGRILGATSTQLRISFQSTFDLNEQGKYWRYIYFLAFRALLILCDRLDVGRSDVAFDRMRAAINHLALDPLQQATSSNADDHEIILQGTALRAVLLRAFKPGARFSSQPTSSGDATRGLQGGALFGANELILSSPHEPKRLPDGDDAAYIPRETLNHPGCFIHRSDGAFADDMRIMSWARRHSRPDPIHVEGDPVLIGMNQTQIRAAAMMIGQRASLVQGVRLCQPIPRVLRLM